MNVTSALGLSTRGHIVAMSDPQQTVVDTSTAIPAAQPQISPTAAGPDDTPPPEQPIVSAFVPTFTVRF